MNCIECNKEFETKKGLSNHMRGGCKTNRNYEKICDCGKVLKYRSSKEYQLSIENNSKCIKCCSKIKEHSIDTKLKISKKIKEMYNTGELVPNMSGAHSEISRSKMSETKKGVRLSDEHKSKIIDGIDKSVKYWNMFNSIDRNIKISNSLKGRVFSSEHIINLTKNHAYVMGIENPFYGRKHSQELILNMRVRYIKVMKNKIPGFQPFFNIKGCEYFDKLMLENNCNIQHALNGGEYHIKELGYFVDGYDSKNNIVYEWDEEHHFNSLGLKEKDINRQNEIINYLKCNFIRIRQSDYIS